MVVALETKASVEMVVENKSKSVRIPLFCRKIKKDQFDKLKNDQLDYEPFVDCQECGRSWHQICALYFEPIWPQG